MLIHWKNPTLCCTLYYTYSIAKFIPEIKVRNNTSKTNKIMKNITGAYRLERGNICKNKLDKAGKKGKLIFYSSLYPGSTASFFLLLFLSTVFGMAAEEKTKKKT